VLHLLIDTSTWLDLARRRDGQKWISTMRTLVLQGELDLLVPDLVVEEFERNRAKVESGMTTSVAQRFRSLRQDIDEYGGTEYEKALEFMGELSHEVPLIGAMTTRNFTDVLELMKDGRKLQPSEIEYARIVQRGLEKRAPFHSGSNSVADALIIELYATSLGAVDPREKPHAFVTTNSKDFSLVAGDKREPHLDLADLFANEGSSYGLGVEGLEGILRDHFGQELDELLGDSDFQEEPRRLAEIASAELELFERVWYHRSVQRDLQREARHEDVDAEMERQLQVMIKRVRARVAATYTEEGQLGPYTDFELGMLNGKLSALRWVLGSEWDFLDT
jgi:hypothetical protein